MSSVVERVVISLPGSPRTARFLAQETAQGFRIHPAFDGRTGAGRDRVDVPTFQHRYGREPAGGEIGCVLSHVDVLASFADATGPGDDLMLVAEDDAVFSSHAEAVIEAVARRGVRGWALLGHGLEDYRYDPFWAKSRDFTHQSVLATPVGPKAMPWKYRLGRAAGEVVGTGLYLVSRDTARALTETVRTHGVSWVADDYVAWHGASNVRVYVLRPTISGWLGDSEIDPDGRGHLAVPTYVANPWGRPAWKRRAKRFRAGLPVTFRLAKPTSSP